jgi:2,5-dihydroxypyridine 5,6-dioxygenase
MAGALELGADVFQVVHSSYEPEREVIKAWQNADLVVDISSSPHAYGHIMREAMDAGTRLMRIAESENTMRRLFPTLELKERVLAGKALMAPAKTMRITSAAGTDLTFYKEGRVPFGIYGFSDVPARWDVFPAGMVNVAPEEWKGEGVLVLAPGDFMLVLNQYIHEPISMEIKNGGIIPETIRGGMQAELLRRWFAQWNAELSYHIAHVGWGCEKRANWMMPGQDHECYYANLLIAFGSNGGIYRDGQTLTKSHIDFACLNTAYWCDNTHIMENGEFVIDELKFKGKADVRRLDN